MNKSLKQVKMFHDTFKVPFLETPQIPSKDRSDLRVTLIQEELDELKEAIEKNDVVEALDALGDILFVLNGTILEFGMGDVFDQTFDDITRSNMSKACSTVEEANDTIEFYKKKDGTESHYEEVNGKFIVYRNKDFKVLKSVKYSPVDIKSIIG